MRRRRRRGRVLGLRLCKVDPALQHGEPGVDAAARQLLDEEASEGAGEAPGTAVDVHAVGSVSGVGVSGYWYGGTASEGVSGEGSRG